MSSDRRSRLELDPLDGGRQTESSGATAPGKRALTDRLPSVAARTAEPTATVQRHASTSGSIGLGYTPGTLDDPFGLHLAPVQAHGGSIVDLDAVQSHAAAGVAGGGAALPHLDTIQRAFGHHDVSGIDAHVGGAAADASRAIGAQAYATGTSVAFASSPDLHLAAHEAAHVVQQRGGVNLKGGVGQSGDAYEQHADAVADAVVRGASAAALLDQMTPAHGTIADGVQRQAAPAAAQAAQPPVDLTVKWRGKLGGDLSAHVKIEGRADAKSRWTTVHTEDIADPDGAAGARSQEMSRVFNVARYAEYQITIVPTAVDPDDRYRKTLKKAQVAAAAPTSTVSVNFTMNRENDKNVDDIWQDKNIDPAKADDVVSLPLFGYNVTVNRIAKPRVVATQAAYLALPPETQVAIHDSLYVVGSRNKRTTTEGFYSNHSTGSAIDVNYNIGTKQAFHFEQGDMALLTKLVQPVVRTDPSFASFKISGNNSAKGVDQLRAADVFNERFPSYLADLMDRSADADRFAEIEAGNAGLGVATVLREAHALQMFDSIAPADINAAIKAAKAANDTKKRAQLELIRDHWSQLRAWLFGALGNSNAKAKGMIPIREDVLLLFTNAGWVWGGDWDNEKDYMHFDDPLVAPAIKKNAPSAAAASAPASTGSSHP